MMPGQKEQAEILRAGLHLGYRSVADAVVWADSIIEADPDPDASIIEVALAGSCSWIEMAELLKNVAGICDPVAVCQALGAPIEASVESALTARNSPADLVAMLGAIAGVCDPLTVMRRALAAMLRVLDRNPQRGETIAKELYQLYASKLFPLWPFGEEPLYLDEVYEFNKPEEALAQLREYLGRATLASSDSG